MEAAVTNGDLTLREAERILTAQTEQYAAHLREHTLLAEAHKEKHEDAQKAVDKAEDTIKAAVDAALVSVEKADAASRLALRAALEDHHREHLTHESAHGREHGMTADALNKAETSMDKRLESIATLLAERDKAWGVRFEDMMRAITNVEKVDVKAEGKQLGQGAVIAIIVTAIGVTGTILGIIIVLSNLITGA